MLRLGSVCWGPHGQFHVDGVSQLTRTGWPVSSMGSWLEQAERLLEARFGANPDQPEPLEGQPPHFSPEQDCLAVGGMIPLRRLREGKRFALVFCWDWDALLPP